MATESWSLQTRRLLSAKGIQASEANKNTLYAYETFGDLQLLVLLLKEARGSGLPLSIKMYDQTAPIKRISEFARTKKQTIFSRSDAYQIVLDGLVVYDLNED